MTTKSKTSSLTFSQALEEVWDWKDEVANDIAKKTNQEKKDYYEEGLSLAASTLGCELIQSKDGTYSFKSMSRSD